jgi:hypothetical protein
MLPAAGALASAAAPAGVGVATYVGKPHCFEAKSMAGALRRGAVLVLGGIMAAAQQQPPAAATIAYQKASGDFLLRANVSECKGLRGRQRSGRDTFEVVFAASGAGSAAQTYASYTLEPATGTIQLIRYRNGSRSVLQTVQTKPQSWGDNGSAPLIVELVHRGTFYLLYLGGSHLTSQPVTYVERPTSGTHCARGVVGVDPQPEPLTAYAGIRDLSGGVYQVNSLDVAEFRWEAAPLPTAPVVTHCASCGVGCAPSVNHTAGCWAYNQIIPGALLRDANGSHMGGGLRDGSSVLYVAGSDFDGTDGGGKQRMGVATGPSLDHLALHPQFLLEGTPHTRDERSLFPNGALRLDNGTVAVTYMGQAQNDSWGGIFLATSECAVGCPWRKHGVVLGCGSDAAHTSGADPMICGGAPGERAVAAICVGVFA